GGHRVDELEGGRNHGALGLQRGQVVQGQANGRGQDGVGGVDDQQLAVGQGDRNRARIHVDDDEVVAVGTASGDGRDPGVVVGTGGQVAGQQAGVAEGGAVVEVHADGEAGGAAQDEVRTGQRDEGGVGNADVGVGIDDVGGGNQHRVGVATGLDRVGRGRGRQAQAEHDGNGKRALLEFGHALLKLLSGCYF